MLQNMILYKACLNDQRARVRKKSIRDVIINLISYEDMDQVGFLIFHQLPIFDGFIKGE